MRRHLPHRPEGTYELEDTALCHIKRARTAFRSNFVNRSIKPPIIVKKTDIRLKEAPFGMSSVLESPAESCLEIAAAPVFSPASATRLARWGTRRKQDGGLAMTLRITNQEIL